MAFSEPGSYRRQGHMKYQFAPLHQKNVQLTSGLLWDRQIVNATVTVPHLLRMLTQTGRIAALTWKSEQEKTAEVPHPFWDSDIGKTIEAISYVLIKSRNEELENVVDSIIVMLEQEQFSDGYLNTFYRINGVENRWTNLYYMHELYCAGHLIEGAVAYFEATSKDKFLHIMCKYADYIYDTFLTNPDKKNAYCGHPEIELALVRLFQTTRDKKYLQLSKHFIDERGNEPYYFEIESLLRGMDTTKTANQKRHLKYFLPSRGPYAEYQAHKPVRLQREVVGHAVRAMYLYSGMADVAGFYDDEPLYAACRAIWDNLVKTQFYITGGVGPASDGERFTYAYDLPNEFTYNETCASVGLVFWAKRMLQFECDSKYSDIMEQTLYNIVLGSVSSKGNKFFYSNYLSVNPERYTHASASFIDKMKAERQEWFNVACCPPNASRLIGSISGYMYSSDTQGVYVHLYSSSSASLKLDGAEVKLNVATDYPWDGAVKIKIDSSAESPFNLGLRIPHWCKDWTVRLNGEAVPFKTRLGYCLIRKAFKSDTIDLNLVMPVFQVEANPQVRENCGRIALQRGPIVYCLEEIDNGPDMDDMAISKGCEFKTLKGIDGLSSNAVRLEGVAQIRDTSVWSEELYRREPSPTKNVPVMAIPYYLWGNRGKGKMSVWILSVP